MTFALVTRLRLRSPWFLPQFLLVSNRSVRQAKATPGNLDVQVRKTEGLTFWTLTLWKNAKAMRAYRDSGVYRAAQPKFANWCDEAATGHWEAKSDEPVTWAIATDKLKRGRLHPVSHPSAVQRAGKINLS